MKRATVRSSRLFCGILPHSAVQQGRVGRGVEHFLGLGLGSGGKAVVTHSLPPHHGMSEFGKLHGFMSGSRFRVKAYLVQGQGLLASTLNLL